MRDHLQIETGTLLANVDQRTVEGLLLPFDELGSTNLGRVRIAADAVADPEDLTVLAVNVEHDQLQPAARFAWLRRAAHGILAGFRVADGKAGDQLLADIKAGKRSKLSVELRDVVRRGDVVTSAVLTGAAFVAAGAFPSAALLASLVDPEELEDLQDDLQQLEQDARAAQDAQLQDPPLVVVPAPAAAPAAQDAQPTTPKTAPAGPPAPTDPPAGAQPAGVVHICTTCTCTTTNPEDTTMDPITTPAVVPAGLHAAHGGAAAAAPALTAQGLFAAMAHARETRSDAALAPYLEHAEAAGALFAALSDVKMTGTGGLAGPMAQPAWLGELWDLRTIRRRIVPLLANRPLTGMKAAGFRWKERPQMGRWNANKTAVPSNAATVEAYEVEAQPFAGAHDVDIRFKHFTVPGFWESYWRSMSDSYAAETDAYAFEQLQAAATELEAGTVPTNVPAGLSYIVDGALQMIDDALPTYAIVAKDLWRDMVLMADEHKLAFLSSALQLDGGDVAGFQIVPAALPAGEVIVGHREAVAFHELDGVPIRVEGLDIVKGGVDPAGFGYAAAVVHDPAGVVKVAAPVPAG